MRLFTSYFANRTLKTRPDLVRVCIALFPPGWRGAFDEEVKLLAPTFELFRRKLPRDEFRRLYHHHLDSIGVGRISAELEAVSRRFDGRDLILLCYERDAAKCHRSDLAAWMLSQTGQPIEELPRPAPRPRAPKNQLALPLDNKSPLRYDISSNT